MNLTHEQLSVSLERLSIKLALSEKARTEQRQEIFRLSDDLETANDCIEMFQGVTTKLYTVLEINNIKLDYEGELH